MEGQYNGQGGASAGRRRRGRRGEGAQRQDGGRQDGGNMAMVPAYGGGGGGGGGRGGPSKDGDVVHHHPPKDMAADVSYPMRGGQTLLIAYFPWEASEDDIEAEFAKFSRVKRVHLVVDKSSRKPRCFGFVKFISKQDAEEALRATMLGLVQLPDTRGHVWHLKAEWTKSGDMVVDDSETEQEVAKRKEERRTRVDQRDDDGGGPQDVGPSGGKGNMNSGHGEKGFRNPKWPPGAGPGRMKGGEPMHASVPAPLPPLQPRYPQLPSPLGLQGQMPMMQHGQGIGPLGVPPMPMPPMLPQHHPHAGGQMPGTVPPQQHMYGNVPGGVQQSLPMYSGYGGQPPAVPPLYPGGVPGGPPSAVPGGVEPRGPPPQEASAPGGILPQPPLRDLLGGASGYGPPNHVYANAQGSYPSHPAGYGPPPQPQNGYVGQPGLPGTYPGQTPYASQQAAAAAASYAGQQAAYAAAASQQGAYAASQQAYAAAQHQQQQPAYPPAYPPQPGVYAPQQPGIPSQPGYAPPPPNYASQAQGYAAQLPAQHPAYASAYGGLVQPPHPQLAPPPPGPYNYPQQMPPAGIPDGSHPGHMPPATGLLPHPAGHPPHDPAIAAAVAAQQHAAAVAHHSMLNANVAGGGPAPLGPHYGSLHPQAQAQDPAVIAASVAQQQHQNQQQHGMATQMVMVPNTLGVQQNTAQPPQAPPVPQEQADEHSGQVVATGSTLTATPGQSPTAGGVQEYFDWNFSEMSIHDKNAAAATAQQQAMPAPPPQQPPAPPGSQGPNDWNVPAPRSAPTTAPNVQPTRPTGPGGSTSLWNSFDDAAAKGMVDGLVGEDGVPAPNWAVHNPSG